MLPTLATENGCLTLGSFLPKAVSGKEICGALLCQAGLRRASNLPPALARKSVSGAASCQTLQEVVFFPLPRSGFLREISWLLPVPKEFFFEGRAASQAW